MELTVTNRSRAYPGRSSEDSKVDGIQYVVLKVCVHEWLSGGVSPCQGEGRGFESRLVLSMIQKRRYPLDTSFFVCSSPAGFERLECLRSAPVVAVERPPVSCSQRDRKRVIRWMALFSMFKPCRARTVRMPAFHSGRRNNFKCL